MKHAIATTALTFGLSATLALSTHSALADDKDTSGKLTTWVVSKDGKDVLGSETLRVVTSTVGTIFASGELNGALGKKKVHRKTHVETDAEGHLLKYQRVEAGLKGPGVRIFDFEGKMRIAPINQTGWKPTDLGKLETGYLWDADDWHLVGLWDLPAACGDARTLAYFDPEKRASAQATLTCTGKKQVFDDGKKAVDVHVLKVEGLPTELELWVDGHGQLVGAKSKDRWMLLAKWSWEAGKPGETAAPGSDEDVQKIEDRGVGE